MNHHRPALSTPPPDPSYGPGDPAPPGYPHPPALAIGSGVTASAEPGCDAPDPAPPADGGLILPPPPDPPACPAPVSHPPPPPPYLAVSELNVEGLPLNPCGVALPLLRRSAAPARSKKFLGEAGSVTPVL